MERDPLTVLEELGGFVNAIDGTVYVSVMVGGRYFSEDLTDCGFADLREAAARLLATVENPPPLPPPPEPVYPSSAAAAFTRRLSVDGASRSARAGPGSLRRGATAPARTAAGAP